MDTVEVEQESGCRYQGDDSNTSLLSIFSFATSGYNLLKLQMCNCLAFGTKESKKQVNMKAWHLKFSSCRELLIVWITTCLAHWHKGIEGG